MSESESILGEDKSKKPIKEIPFVHDEGSFEHATGDKYEGEFEAKKKDKYIKMQGHGVYTTAEGDVYEGNWETDRLGVTDPVSISYNDGAKYNGLLKDWCYQGTGKYTYPDESFIQCEFNENCPSGKMVLVDPNKHKWLGKADSGFAWFEPVNHFYDLIDEKKDLEENASVKKSKSKAGKK